MVKQRTCEHKLMLPLYARGKDFWESSQKIAGKMVYICTKCGAILDKGFIERDTLYTSDEGGRE